MTTSHHDRPHRHHDGRDGLHDHADRFSRRVTESAQQVWLAGLGAFGRAQAEGSRLFDSLVNEGRNIEEKARTRPDAKADGLADSVEQTLGQARDRAAGTWDRVERTFEDRVQRVLRTLQIPSRADIEELNARIDALTTRLNRAENRVNAAAAANAVNSAQGGAGTPPTT